MNNKRYQVFISSSYADLKDERKEIMQTIKELNCFPIGYEIFPASDTEPFEFAKSIIDESDYYVLIIAGRYGGIAGDGLGYTEKEFDYAKKKGIPILAFIKKDIDSIPNDKKEQDYERRKKLKAFRDKVTYGRLACFWDNTSELTSKIQLSLLQEFKKHPSMGRVNANEIIAKHEDYSKVYEKVYKDTTKRKNIDEITSIIGVDKFGLLKELEEMVQQLPDCYTFLNDDRRLLESLTMSMKLYAKKIFGENNDYTQQINNVRFAPEDQPASSDDWDYNYVKGKETFQNIIKTMKREVELDMEDMIKMKDSLKGNKIFVVHGHNEEMKEKVARFLEHLDLHPVILHEQPDRGRNVLDKLIEESKQACFAIILLSPDDYGYSVKDRDEDRKTRGRQNVILELGFFIGKLGKDNVVALYQEDKNFDLPSDVVGTLYKKYDLAGAWKKEIAKELRAAGIQINADKFLDS